MRSPMLAPNYKPAIDSFEGFLFGVSRKMDGVRAVLVDGYVLGRKLEPLRPATQNRFSRLAQFAKEKGYVLDGELWSPKLTFPEIQSYLADGILATAIKFYAFDILSIDEWNEETTAKRLTAGNRDKTLRAFIEDYNKSVDSFGELEYAEQAWTFSRQVIKDKIQEGRDGSWEGIMLRNAYGLYKFGRCTVKENLLYKYKFSNTVDARIVGFKQGTSLTEEAKAETGEMRKGDGTLDRGHRKDDREFVDRIGSVEMEVAEGQEWPEGTRFFASFAESAYELRVWPWAKREELLGTRCTLEYQLHGSQDKPRGARIQTWER